MTRSVPFERQGDYDVVGPPCNVTTEPTRDPIKRDGSDAALH